MDIVKIVILVFLALVLVVGGWQIITTVVQGNIDYVELKEAVKAGEIVDKQMMTSNGIFRAPTVVYCFYVSGEVVYNDELRTVEKSFVVTENIYNQYSVGDWFDSQNLITSDEVVSDSAA